MVVINPGVVFSLDLRSVKSVRGFSSFEPAVVGQPRQRPRGLLKPCSNGRRKAYEVSAPSQSETDDVISFYFFWILLWFFVHLDRAASVVAV